jgi:hypothetical protein
MTTVQRLEDRLARVEAITQTPRQVLVVLSGYEGPEGKERARQAAFDRSGLPVNSNPSFVFVKTGVRRSQDG